MKLYEFSYTDNLNQSEADVLKNIDEILEMEAESQCWAPGYKFNQCRSVERLPSGERCYHFEVSGAYIAPDDIDATTGNSSVKKSSSGVAAAPRDLLG